jgi:hypothetical protein
LEPGQSTTVELTYAPSDDIADQGKLVIGYTRGDAPELVIQIISTGQTNSLQIVPSPVQFGAIAANEPVTKGVRIFNLGQSAVTMRTATVDKTLSPDFDVVGFYSFDATDGCIGLDQAESVFEEGNIELAADGGAVCVDIKYSPTGGGADNGMLQVYGPYDESKGNLQPVLVQAALIGSEVGPEIAIEPAQINFGGVSVGNTSVQAFAIQNTGNADLIIDSVLKGEAQEDAWADIKILTDVAPGTVVPATEAILVEVEFAPSQSWPISYGPLGFVEVASNDSDEPTSFVNVTGQVAEPKLIVTPSEVIDFGYVATSYVGERSLTFTNVGSADLVVSSIAIGTNSASNEFGYIEPTEELVIPGNDFRVVTFTFENKGGLENEVVEGTATFQTNDPNGQTTVGLRAKRTSNPRCDVQLNPVSVNYGVVPFDGEKTMTMNMINVGSAPCSFSHITITEGGGQLPLPFPIPGFSATCTAKAFSDSDTKFTVLNSPPGIKDFLKPGDAYPLEIKYTPEGNIFSSPETLQNFAGLVQVHMLDFANPADGNDWSVVTAPAAAPGEQVDCNLEGTSGIAALAAIPGQVDFGLTTVGCHSDTKTVTIYNKGAAPVSVCDVVLDGCGPEVKLKNVPPIAACTDGGGGIVITQSQPIEVEVVYAPQNLGDDGCTLLIVANENQSPSISVPLKGEGTYDTEHTDEYTQLSGQMVDVLFVVDNSGSMSDEQSSLASNFSYFTQAAGQWNTDFQIGVVSTDMDENNDWAGKLLGYDIGNSSGQRFVQNPNVSTFSDMVQVGDNGSGTEQGLEAAYQALSAPLITFQDPIVECTSSSECTAPAECVPSVIDPGKKFCGGWNIEFMREDATLEIVFVSDEEDGSPGALTFYVDFLKSIKGFLNTSLFHAHAIVGPNGGCEQNGNTASDGARYRTIAQETGGKIHSICDTDWASKMEDIGNIAFGLKVQFLLTRPAIPETIEITVDGTPCTTGWTYDQATNSVIFDENGSCMPQENQQISINYEVICYSE